MEGDHYKTRSLCHGVLEGGCVLYYVTGKMEQVFHMYQGMESNKETCRDIVEQVFFPPIWPNLVQLYRYESTGYG